MRGNSLASGFGVTYTSIMYATFADPRTDFVFKRIFGVESRKHLLIALINHLLELDDKHRVVDIQHTPPDQHVDIPELKMSIVDVKCTDVNGRRFVVEMQILKIEGFEKRVVYNASKAYVMQLRSGDDYPLLCDVVGITICNFNLWTDTDASGSYKVPMLSRWRMQEQRSGVTGLSHIQYTFLELPKYNAGHNPVSLIDKWAYFFREAKNIDVVPPALAEQPFAEALDVARRATFTAAEWEYYDRLKMAEQDARGAISIALKDGMEQGLNIGIKQGIEKGIEQGEALGKRSSLLKLLTRAKIELDPAQRAQIDACNDVALLDQWFDRALGASSADDVFGG